MELNKNNKRESLSSLIDLATKGFYPLFHKSWIEEACLERPFTLSRKQLQLATIVMQRLAKQTSIERKKTILLALNDVDRKIFVKAFLTMVESRMTSSTHEYH